MSTDIASALADLRKAIDENPDRDRFPRGAVIRWTANGRYTYAAIKTGFAWFTTSRSGNRFIKQQMNYEELQEVLSRDEVTDIAVASDWVRLDGSPASEGKAPGPFAPWDDARAEARSYYDREEREHEDDYPGLGGESI